MIEYKRVKDFSTTDLQDLLAQYKDFMYITVVPDEKKNVAFYEKHGFSVMSEGTPLQIRGFST